VTAVSWLKSPIVVVVATQALFTIGDLMARANMRKHGFTAAAFLNLTFVAYFAIRQVAMFGQLFILASVPIRSYAGIALAVLAFTVMGFAK